jgi:hypothetical protein
MLSDGEIPRRAARQALAADGAATFTGARGWSANGRPIQANHRTPTEAEMNRAALDDIALECGRVSMENG